MKAIIYFVFFGFAACYVVTKSFESDSYSEKGLLLETKENCNAQNDSFACMKLKLMESLDAILSQYFEIRSNGYVNENTRSIEDPHEFLEDFLRSHDVIMKFPDAETNVLISGRKINMNEVDVKFNFSGNEASASDEGRRNKMKRMIIPIMVLILLKAMTLIPMALGVLALKAFNSLQLGFISFLVSVSLAIFQICKKLAIDNSAPHVVAHPHWDSREFLRHNEDSHNLAYNAHS